VGDTGGPGTSSTVPRGKRHQCGGKPPTLCTASARVYYLIFPATTAAASSAASHSVPQSLRGLQSHSALGSAANANSSVCVRGTTAGSPPPPPPPIRDERMRYVLETPPALPRISLSSCLTPSAVEGGQHRRQCGPPTGASELARTMERIVDGWKRWNPNAAAGDGWAGDPRTPLVARQVARWPPHFLGLRLHGWAVGAARTTAQRAGAILPQFFHQSAPLRRALRIGFRRILQGKRVCA